MPSIPFKKNFGKKPTVPHYSQSQHEQTINQRNTNIALLQSQIDDNKKRTKEADLARIQSLNAAAEHKTSVRNERNRNYILRSTNPTTTFPSNGLEAFRHPPKSQTVGTQTIETHKNSTKTQTNDSSVSDGDPRDSNISTEPVSQKKRVSVKFPPRLQLPLDIYKNHETSQNPIKKAIVFPTEDKRHATNINDRFELAKQEQQKEAEKRRKKEETRFEELTKIIQSNHTVPFEKHTSTHPKSLHPNAISNRSPIQKVNMSPNTSQKTSLDIKPYYKHHEKEIVETKSGSYAVIGLPKTGRSTLVGALAGGVWPKNLFQNPIVTNLGTIYKLNYPNNGFVNGSVNENRAIYEEFFESSKLSNLSTLIITIDGPVREEDYLVLSLAQQYRIPTVIARTKLDEWLDNRPKQQSKEDYVADDKKYVIKTLQKFGINFPANNIFNVSALATIVIKEDGPKSDMLRYLQDDNTLLEFLRCRFNSNKDKEKKVIDVDIVVAGIKGAGKSAIIETLRQRCKWPKREKIIVEFCFDETMTYEYVVSKLNCSNPKLYILVIPNTVGRLDAEIAGYLINSKRRLCVSLNKSDEMIDNLERQHLFYGKEDCICKRLESAKNEFKKVNAWDVSCYTTSALVLAGFLSNKHATQEVKFLTFVENVLNSRF